jgi:hypothetical protein
LLSEFSKNYRSILNAVVRSWAFPASALTSRRGRAVQGCASLRCSALPPCVGTLSIPNAKAELHVLSTHFNLPDVKKCPFSGQKECFFVAADTFFPRKLLENPGFFRKLLR